MATERYVDVAIIGGGTAGLSAVSEVSKVTENFVLLNAGPDGTTCARVGCMPSKVLIQVANDFHRRHLFMQQGISGSEQLRIDLGEVLQYVRSLRDGFVNGVRKTLDSLGDRFQHGHAQFREPTVLEVDNHTIHAKRIIIATGSSPIIPPSWQALTGRLLTTDTLFEQPDVPSPMAIIGLGAVGLEICQAVARLGVQVTGIDQTDHLGGLTDPEVNSYVRPVLTREFPMYTGAAAEVGIVDTQLVVRFGNNSMRAKQILASLGRRPNTAELGLERLGVPLDNNGLPPFDPTTMQVGSLPIFIAGDVNDARPVLHEASDEGRIAGFNSVQEHPHCFQRRTPLLIVFSEPNVAVVGQSFAELKDQDIAIGEARFDNQGRAKIMAERTGLIRIYGKKTDGRILGAELAAPRGEHLAHLLAWAIQQKMTAFAMLQLPFYHPVIEEGVRTALRTLSKQVRAKQQTFDLAICDSAAVEGLE
ncbi:MAG: dihydrolipoyl dehydrogenase [Candidatus Binatia bacterium]